MSTKKKLQAADDEISLLKEIKQILREIKPEVQRIAVDGHKSIILLDTSDICYITTDGRKLLFYTADGKQYYNYDSLSELEKKFSTDPRYLRAHRSFIINMDQLKEIFIVPGGREVTFLTLPPETKIPVAYSAVKKLEAYFHLKDTVQKITDSWKSNEPKN